VEAALDKLGPSIEFCSLNWPAHGRGAQGAGPSVPK